MSELQMPHLFRWIAVIAIALFACVGWANAAGSLVPVRLPKGVTVELPRNWTTLSNNQRITLDSLVQSRKGLSGFADASSDLAFAANYYDDQGKTAAIFNIRFYSDLKITQAEARSAGKADVIELDTVIRQNIVPGIEMSGGRLVAWLGTTKQSINGNIAFVSEYRRSSSQGGSGFRARLVRIFNGSKSFTITMSYREDQEHFLSPICDRVISSIRI